MPDCEKILNLIPLYIDNMLSDEENDEVIRHLKTCTACQGELKYLKSIIGATNDIPEVELPLDFHKNLMEKAEKIKQENKKKRYLTFKRAGAYVAAAAVVALSFVAFGEFTKPKDEPGADRYLASEISPEPYNYTQKTDLSKARAGKTNDALLDKSTSLKEKTSKETKNSNVENKEKQAEDMPASISVADEEIAYTTATVEVTEEIKEEILKILSKYEKDEKGYIVPDINEVIEKIKSLGATVEFKTDSAITKNYVVVK